MNKITKEFDNLRKEILKSYDDRERIIQESRDILKLSKSAIYSVHRGERKEARNMLDKAKKEILKLRKMITVENKNNHYNAAMQEYVEAACFLSIVEKNKLVGSKELGVIAEDYLAGLSDLTGELGRRAVLLATKKDKGGVQKILDMMNDIYGEMIKIDFRNSELRKKFDAIKWNLKKVEELMYDLSK